MARVILAVDDRRRPFFGNSGVVVFPCLGFLQGVAGDIELSQVAPNCRLIVAPMIRRDYRRSKRQTRWVSRPIRITACYGCFDTCRLDRRRLFNLDWVTASPIEAPHPPSRRRLFLVRSTAVLPFLRLHFCWRGLYSRRVPRTSAIPSSGPPCEPTISSAPAGALSRRMPRRRT
jgi:hypothetical protein